MNFKKGANYTKSLDYKNVKKLYLSKFHYEPNTLFYLNTII